MENRFSRDDIIPMLRDSSIATTLKHWIGRNASETFLIELIQIEHGILIDPSLLRQLVSDLWEVDDLEGCDVSSLPVPINRPAAPGGLGCSGGNVWVTPPATPYTLRFYVNGVHALTMDDYNTTSLESIGAVAGDIVQVGLISDGVAGWWARIKAV
jgi:hypothetical protein